jgi:DNA modification methylase
VTLIDAIRTFIKQKKGPVHLQDLYAHLPDALEHSIRAGIYERLGKEFTRVGKGIYVAIEGEATCIVAHGDALEEVKQLGTQSVDALVTDPPYDWLDHFVEAGTTRRRMNWKFDRKDIDRELGLEIYRVLKEGAHAFIFVPAETKTTRPHIERLITTLEQCGFVFQKRWVWNKVTFGMGYSGRARYEGILFMTRGYEKRQPCDFSVPDVIDCPMIQPNKRVHPCQKPQPLLESILRFATEVGETVLDLYAGSCALGRAALAIGRNAILIEKDKSILKLAGVL